MLASLFLSVAVLVIIIVALLKREQHIMHKAHVAREEILCRKAEMLTLEIQTATELRAEQDALRQHSAENRIIASSYTGLHPRPVIKIHRS